jgi:hypothetical protein
MPTPTHITASSFRKRLKFSFTLSCPCGGADFVSEDKHELIADLLKHIRNNHLTLYDQLLIEARMKARRDCGFGYIDTDDYKQTDDRNEGWWAAQQSFRDAWTRSVLECMVTGG